MRCCISILIGTLPALLATLSFAEETISPKEAWMAYDAGPLRQLPRSSDWGKIGRRPFESSTGLGKRYPGLRPGQAHHRLLQGEDTAGPGPKNPRHPWPRPEKHARWLGCPDHRRGQGSPDTGWAGRNFWRLRRHLRIKQLVVRHQVAVTGITQLLLKLGSIVLSKFCGHPII